MVENGLYVIKRDFLEIIRNLGGDCDVVANNVHAVMKKQDDINEIKRKFKRILSMESRRPNYFPRHITDIKKYLVNEINDSKKE